MCVTSGGIYLADVILSAFSASGSHNIAGELFTVDLALGVLHAQVHGPVSKASPPDAVTISGLHVAVSPSVAFASLLLKYWALHG